MTLDEVMASVDKSIPVNNLLRYLPAWIRQQFEFKKLQESIAGNEMAFANDLDLSTQLAKQSTPKKMANLKDTSAAVFYAVPYLDKVYLVKVFKESFESSVKFELLGEVNTK